jgi:hypothetical protein
MRMEFAEKSWITCYPGGSGKSEGSDASRCLHVSFMRSAAKKVDEHLTIPFQDPVILYPSLREMLLPDFGGDILQRHTKRSDCMRVYKQR